MPITFFVRPKKVIKEMPPRFDAATRFPRSATSEPGCATKTKTKTKTCY
jgi:hypothetical protein